MRCIQRQSISAALSAFIEMCSPWVSRFKGKTVAKMLKAIHAQESKQAASCGQSVELKEIQEHEAP